MQSRMLADLEVSEVGLGCNNFGWRMDASATDRVVGAALDAGITLFDTADVYGGQESERQLGAALGRRRDEAIIATKFGSPLGSDPAEQGASPAWIAKAVDGSLRRLAVDHIDLYQLHRPDPDVPIAETLGALHELVVDGKVRAIGHSNFTGPMIDDAADAALSAGTTPFASAQNHYNLLRRDVEADGDVLDACTRHDVGLLPYFPLASGVLTGKYRPGEPPPPDARLAQVPAERAADLLGDATLEAVRRLDAWAALRDHSVAELAFSWLLSRPAVASVIAGATTVDQVRANARSGSWQLTPDDLAEIDDILTPISQT